jgi:hypothetical protein
MNLPEWDTLTKAGEVPPPSPETLARAQFAVREAAGRDVAGWSVMAGRRSRRQLLVPALGVATVAVVAVAGSLLAGPSPDAPPVAGDQPTPTGTMPSFRGDDTAASCVGSPEEGDWLKKQAFAFDGTVLTVEEPIATLPEHLREMYTVVTFKVTRWYKGGQGATVQALMPGPADPSRHDWNSVSGYGLPFQLGDRMLVSGQVFENLPASSVNWVGWACGFSGLYEAKTARLWAGTFDR